MVRLTIKLNFILVITLIITSCYYDNEEDLYPLQTCDTEAITYAETIKPIIDQNCALSGCHVPGTGRVDYTTFQGLKIVADDGRLRQRAVVERTMPPSGPLSSCEIEQIELWLNEGALNN